MSDPIVRQTGRWRGGIAVVLVAAAIGLLAQRPSLLLVAAVGVGMTAYPRLMATPDPQIELSRHIETTPDDRIAVTTTIKNTGSKPLFDCRIIDGVPPMLTVVDGSPRGAMMLTAGEEATLSYELANRPGGHQFQPTTVLCRDPSGTVEVELAIDEPTEVDTAAELPTVPLRSQHNHSVGRLSTEQPGEGIEFHSVEQYNPGDPVGRIDWRRFAATGELTTVAFRTSVTAEVLICIDTSAAAYRAQRSTDPHAVAYAVDAAMRIGDALFDANHHVGVAAFGGKHSVCAPAGGREQAARFHDRLRTGPAFTLTPPPTARTEESVPTRSSEAPTDTASSTTEQIAAIKSHCTPATQLLVITPACDDSSVRFAHQFDSTPVTVISPNVTTGETAGGIVARQQRADRITALRNAEIPVIDWDPETPLGATLEAVRRRQQ